MNGAFCLRPVEEEALRWPRPIVPSSSESVVLIKATWGLEAQRDSNAFFGTDFTADPERWLWSHLAWRLEAKLP